MTPPSRGSPCCPIVVLNKYVRRAPAALLAVALAAIGAAMLHKWLPGFRAATIAQSFDFAFGNETMSGIPPLPPLPAWPWHRGGVHVAIDFTLIRALLPSAFAIAILAAISGLTAAVVADGLANTEHEPNAELLALGVANCLCPLFGGLAATGTVFAPLVIFAQVHARHWLPRCTPVCC